MATPTIETVRAVEALEELRTKEEENRELTSKLTAAEAAAEAAKVEATAAQDSVKEVERKRALAEDRLLTAESALREGHRDLALRKQRLDTQTAAATAALAKENEALKKQLWKVQEDARLGAKVRGQLAIPQCLARADHTRVPRAMPRI